MRSVRIQQGHTHTEEDDIRGSTIAQVYAVDTGNIPSMIYWNGKDCCLTIKIKWCLCLGFFRTCTCESPQREFGDLGPDVSV